MKKIFSFFICIAIIIVTLPFSNSVAVDAASTKLNGVNITYSVVNGEVIITDCDENISGDVTIPDSINGLAVTQIGASTFSFCEAMTSITIPASVKNIGPTAFLCCDNLKNINVDVSNTAYCSVDGVLFNKNKTDLLCFPVAKTSSTYKTPESLLNIDTYAFAYCSNITEITITKNVESIGDFAFSYSANLKKIIVDANNRTFSSDAGVLFDKVKKSLIYYPINKEDLVYTVPISVTDIEQYAFDGSANVENVILHNYISDIGKGAFRSSKKLTTISIPSSVTIIESFTFQGCSKLKDVTIPNSVTIIDSSAFFSCTSLEEIIIPNSVNYIGNTAFCDCRSLKKINIPSSVICLYFSTFRACSSLASIKIPDSVTSMEESVFEGCKSLKSITLPNFLTEIKGYLFYGCSALESVTIPESVTNIDYLAFSSCISLENVYYTGTQESWNKINIEYGNSYLSNATIHYNFTPPTDVSGDLNGNGMVSCEDLILLRKALFGIIKVDENQPDVYDVNGDGKFNILDLVSLKKIVVNLPVNYGDANGDGSINASDLIVLKSVILGAMTVDITTQNASDVNADGEVNVLDLIRLKKYIAGMNVVLGRAESVA